MEKIDISVVVPVYREEHVIGEFYRALDKVMKDTGMRYEIIFTDDQSDTATVASIKRLCDADKNVKLLSLSRNFGHQVALTAGIDLAKGDAVVMLDGDLQHPPEMIPVLLDNWKNGYDIVYTIRQDVDGISLFKKFTSHLFYSLMSRISNVDMDFNCADFRLMSRKAVEGFKTIRESTRFIRGLVGWMGYKKIGVPFKGLKRQGGGSKYSLKKLLKFALDGILSFSVFPIRLISIVGLFVSFISFLYIIRVAYYVFFTSEKIPNWQPITTILLFAAGIQMLMLGVLGEYIAKMFTETKNRPLYLIDEIYSLSKEKEQNAV